MKTKQREKNWPLVGNDHIIDFFQKSIKNKKISGTYIFNGVEDLGKTTIALHLAKCLLCTADKESACNHCSSCRKFQPPEDKADEDHSMIAHTDLYLIKKPTDKKNISIEQIRSFINSLSMTSFAESYKIGIIKQAEKLSIEASNSLLKTLEEPRRNVVIILITSNLEGLPATIVSRSQVLNFYPVKTDLIYDYLINEHKASRSKAKNISRLSLGKPALAIKFLEDNDFYLDFISRSGIFLEFFNQDINERLKNLEKFTAKLPREESAVISQSILNIWSGVIRDLMLLSLNHNDLIQYEIHIEKISKLGKNIQINKLLRIRRLIEEAQEYIKSNVSPKLALENVVFNLDIK